MRASLRCFGLLTTIIAGCGDDPVPLTGQASWGDSCPPSNPCNPGVHAPRGAAGSPTVDVDCSLRGVSGGYNIFFRIATITQGGNFDESSEGLSVAGFLPAIGQELRAGAELNATATIRGLGWVIAAVPIGPTMQCHVFIDRIASGGFVGRIACPMVVDTSVTPNRTRIIRGGSTATVPEFGDFVFTNCSTGG